MTNDHMITHPPVSFAPVISNERNVYISFNEFSSKINFMLKF